MTFCPLSEVLRRRHVIQIQFFDSFFFVSRVSGQVARTSENVKHTLLINKKKPNLHPDSYLDQFAPSVIAKFTVNVPTF